jgi:hypothetical protein
VPSEVYWSACDPIMLAECKSAFRRLKDGAPVPDGIKKKELPGLGLINIVQWSNLFLYRGFLPNTLKQGTTSLIPRVELPTSPAQYRPITIGSIILRFFHSILATRLDRIPISVRQKGYCLFDGVGENVWLVKSLIKNAAETLRPLHLAFLDVRKAFDSVSHNLMSKACVRAGVPAPLVTYLMAIKSGNVTVLRDNPQRRPINVTIGIKLCEPTSAPLFNFVVDWNASDLNPDIGISVNNKTINNGELADDTFLCAATKMGLQLLTDKFVSNLSFSGMQLNSDKCATLAIGADGKRKRWFVNPEPYLKVDQSVVPAITITYKYLGIRLGAASSDESYFHSRQPRKSCYMLPVDVATKQKRNNSFRNYFGNEKEQTHFLL